MSTFRLATVDQAAAVVLRERVDQAVVLRERMRTHMRKMYFAAGPAENLSGTAVKKNGRSGGMRIGRLQVLFSIPKMAVVDRGRWQTQKW